MGLFDFALRPGQRFSKEELRVLDQNLNSISAYTKKNIDFLTEVYLMIFQEHILELIVIEFGIFMKT